MPESFRTGIFRRLFNLFPACRGAGGRVTHIEGDFREIRKEVPLGWRTLDDGGTISGGIICGAVERTDAGGTVHAVVEQSVRGRVEEDRGLREGGSA